MPISNKSTRHSKLTGDFAESLVLYWLSRDGFECNRMDHTGIDLLAYNRYTRRLMGISVKSRSRHKGSEKESVSWDFSEFKKADEACEKFRCDPHFAVVVDAHDKIKMLLLTQDHLKTFIKPSDKKFHWRMTPEYLERYRKDPEIMHVEFVVTQGFWWSDKTAKPVGNYRSERL